MRAQLRKASLSGVVLCLFLATTAGGATIKKWVDENGVTHYGTSIPAEYRDQAYSELDKRGIERRRHDRALTPEEIEREKELAALRAEQQKLIEEQQARDRILLNLYRNEDDLVMARDGKMAALDSQIQLTHGEIRRLKSRLSDFQAAAAAAERSGKQLSAQQKANLETTQRSIEKSYAIILGKEDEKRMTMERYEQDLIRFRQLRKSATPAPNAELVQTSDIPDLVDTAVRCEDEAECLRLWRIAQDYARANATTPVDLAAERILVTAPPRAIRDISITVSRLEDPAQGGERIFMDVQCAGFTEAREFCRGAEVSRIRSGFRGALLLR